MLANFYSFFDIFDKCCSFSLCSFATMPLSLSPCSYSSCSSALLSQFYGCKIVSCKFGKLAIVIVCFFLVNTHQNGQNAISNIAAKVDLLLWGSLCLGHFLFYLNRNLWFVLFKQFFELWNVEIFDPLHFHFSSRMTFGLLHLTAFLLANLFEKVVKNYFICLLDLSL